ncbi:MAG: AAA family ATPase [Thiobacillaceae bacterium]
MKLAFLDLCGFRGYRKPIRIEFADGFTIIDGRNGVGKSTIFDAIEFALTGTLSKYGKTKADGETVTDYVWWTGEGPLPVERYVEVGFRDHDGEVSIRRTQFADPDTSILENLAGRLCDSTLAPVSPLSQLCATTIIRDEHITSLSLDLKETDRYTLLRDALGANDADAWIARGAQLVSLTKQRMANAQQDVTTTNAEVAASARRLDEVRAGLVDDIVMAGVVERLQMFANTILGADLLAGPVRARIAAVGAEIESLRRLSNHWNTAEEMRSRIDSLSASLQSANAEKDGATTALRAFSSMQETAAASGLNDLAGKLIALVALGRQLGLRDGHCPLCAKGQTHEEFEQGIEAAETLARRLNEDSARAAEREQARAAAERKLATATKEADAVKAALLTAKDIVNSFEQERDAQGIAADATVEQVTVREAQLRQRLDAAQTDLRILETLRLRLDLERAQRAVIDTNTRLARAQERFGRARKAWVGAQALHDAARRAAAETLDRRLERVLPLMSELFRRLRPHPIWNDIEYSIRGDVRRFLKLQVGENLNPQFLFSSGQRRATGLAFLLSVNLSLAWSRWRTILLDDPVQHVDDFRTVHLAELVAQLVSEGRQIICAVEDAALADLLCRRLPVDQHGSANKISLGPDTDGALAKVAEHWLSPLVRNSLVGAPEQLAAG